jgi:hypothetical protein
MPHDKNGKLISRGDIIKVPVYDQALPPKGLTTGARMVVGVVRFICESQSCTGMVRVMSEVGEVTPYFNASDAELILKADGTEPVDVAAPVAAAPDPAPAATDTPPASTDAAPAPTATDAPAAS